MAAAPGARAVGNYRLYDELGSGGMGSVHLGRLFASGGFRRTVAIKRLHPHLAQNVDFVSGFLDEARLASRIHHPNVIAPLDVVSEGGEVFLVFEFMLGVSLSTLSRVAAAKGEPLPPRIALKLLVDVLDGLQAAHEATGDAGEPLGLIHRDVSPQNILVGAAGTAFLLDFGIAKAANRAHDTDEGIIKGKRGYMAPEHLLGRSCLASDLYAAAVVLWELVVQRRLFPDESTLAERISGGPLPWPDRDEVEEPLRSVLVRALDPDPEKRFASARDLSHALEGGGLATAREVGAWVGRICESELAEQARLVARAESALEAPLSLRTPAPAVDDATTESGMVHSALAEANAPALDALAPLSRGGRRRRWVPLAAIGFVVLAALTIVIALRRDRAPSQDASTASSAAASPPQATTALPDAAPTAELPARPEPSAAPPPVVARPRPAGPRKGAPGCKPYTVDKNGRTQFNEECLDKNR